VSGSANPAAAPDGCSVRQGLEHAARFLKRHACQTPMLDAQLLLGQVLGVDRCALLRDADSVPLPGQVREFEHLLRRRALHEPVAYLTGNKEFWSLDFLVDPRVLIPRPDTETVMEEVQDLFMARAPARFIDVGCGCACLACALASMFPVAEGLAIDIFCYRIKKYIGAYTAVLGRLDALVFTGGIGENAVLVRERACAGLEAIGVHVDPQRNEEMNGKEGRISTDDSPVGVYIVPTDEELVIARDTVRAVAGAL